MVKKKELKEAARAYNLNYKQTEEFSSKVKEGMLRAKERGIFSGGFVDLTGKAFGRLVVQEQASHGASGRVRWVCKCTCGGQSIVSAENLVTGRTKSCGCGMGVRKSGRNPAAKYIWFNYKGSAKHHSRAFDLTPEQFAHLISQPCDYCGKPPAQKMSPSQMRHESYADFRWNGLDRIDSSKGYTDDNVVPCCKTCNELKSDKTREEFLSAIEAIHRWQHAICS